MDVTRILQAWGAGDPQALAEAIPLVFNQLRTIALNLVRYESAGHTLQPTALVNELYLRLVDQHGSRWRDRREFFAFAAMLMRRILIDYARRSLSQKRGGDLRRAPLNEEIPWLGSSLEEVVALEEALLSLEQVDSRKVRVIEARVLLGCTAAETAELLQISKATVDREWTMARAWLYRELTRTRAGTRA